MAVSKRSSVGYVLAAMVVCAASASQAADWPQFRGAASNSVVDDAQPPISWSDKENIAWKAELPGRGPSSPIVVGNKVLVTCSSGVNQDRLHVLCFEAASGQRLWERQFWATGRTISHPSSANAAPTPASDGRYVFAFYSSNDLVCLDLDGNLKWLRGLAFDYPRAGNDVGMSSSPVVVGDVVVAQVECQGDSFVTGVDKETGEPRWRLDRPREPSWSSPVLVPATANEAAAVLVQSPSRLTAIDVASGKQRWAYDVPCDGISSAVVGADVVFVPSKGVTALRPTSAESPEVLWNESRLQPGAASMLYRDGRLYMINRAGVLTCGDAKNGETLWRARLEGEFWGTPAMVGNRLYAVSQDGKGQVVEVAADGSSAQVVGGGQVEGPIQSSPAVSNGALYVRSDKYLWKIAAP
ncbi:MAG: PQQ-binding-like beta-propeller repeat protein [Pirellulales bacterium]